MRVLVNPNISYYKLINKDNVEMKFEYICVDECIMLFQTDIEPFAI